VEERYRRALLRDRSLTLLQVLGMRTAFPIEQIYIRLCLHEKPEIRYLSPRSKGNSLILCICGDANDGGWSSVSGRLWSHRRRSAAIRAA
jgi:hypothetical protein